MQGITFVAVEHASLVIKTADKVIAVDPVGEAAAYSKHGQPDMILITHPHHDHLNVDVVNALKGKETVVVGPKAVVEALGFGTRLDNGQEETIKGVKIVAVPAYNLSPDRLKFHPKGLGNGYVLTVNGKRIYISGDTEDIPEMRKLKDIDQAFVCMNLPYTMTVEQAASAVLEMKPHAVTPYHYRGQGGFSDLVKFKQLVSKDKSIEVKFLDWYGAKADGQGASAKEAH